MKHVKKDRPRQQRRERTLARLEKYLAGGVKKVKEEFTDLDMAQNAGSRMVTKVKTVTKPFTERDINRIKGEIATLKQRLGGVAV